MAAAARTALTRAAKLVESTLTTTTKAVQPHYEELLKRNAQYIAKEPTVEKCNELGRQFFFTNLASIPARVDIATKEYHALRELLKNWKELDGRRALELGLFAGELYCWSAVGEVIGRGSLLGYSF